uniref:Secreted protein n=1 Tax=Romanomermis culicivorax TaxID=13658 RepID=A0A915KCB7_ROMCU
MGGSKTIDRLLRLSGMIAPMGWLSANPLVCSKLLLLVRSCNCAERSSTRFSSASIRSTLGKQLEQENLNIVPQPSIAL